MAHEGHTYIITAAHVAVDLIDCPFGVRLNREDNGLGDIDYIDHTTWYFHPNNSVDLAVMVYEPPKWAKVNYSKSKWIATNFKLESKRIGPGDIAYVIGVFQKMRGKDRNLPVVHTGNIGAMAYGEKLITNDWRPGAKEGDIIEIEGYLVQVSTLPESSGSPVYVRRSLEVKGGVDVSGDKGTPIRTWVYGSAWLLGVWHGDWDTEEKGVVVGANTGVCTPAWRILEVLEREDLTAIRQTANDKRQASGTLQPQKSPSKKRKAL